MYLLIIQLFKSEYKDDIFLALTSCGIKRASFFEGFNLDKVLQQEFSLFSGIIRTKEQKERYSMLITGVVDKKERVDDFIDVLKEADIDIKKEDILRIVLIPASVIIDSELSYEE